MKVYSFTLLPVPGVCFLDVDETVLSPLSVSAIVLALSVARLSPPHIITAVSLDQ